MGLDCERVVNVWLQVTEGEGCASKVDWVL